jgi:ribosomal protein S20
VRGGASASILRGHWRAAAKVAFQAFRNGDKIKAAEWFREAANRIEKTIT